MSRGLTSLLLLLTLSTITSSQFIFLEINSRSLANNSLISITEVGDTLPTSLQCNTTKIACCDSVSTGTTGMGNWYLPSGEVLTRESNTAPEVDFYRNRRSGGIDLLRRNNATLPEGVFRCEIPRSSGALEMVYVGLYAEGNGTPSITTLTTNVPSLSLLCTSTGGPPTDVTWTVNNATIATDGPDYSASSILTDSEQATYMNVLTASSSELFLGNFTCTVSNLAGNDTQSIEVVSDVTPGPTDDNTTAAPPPEGLHFRLGSTVHSNNSLVTLIEITEEAPVLCITDNPDCCEGTDGQWIFPNRTLVQTNSQGRGMYRTRREFTIRLHRRDGVSTEGGIFECDGILDSAGVERSLYVGIYPEGEGQPEVTEIFEEVGSSLTCTSTGGPASLVTWQREGVEITSGPDFSISEPRVTDFASATYVSVLESLTTGSLTGTFTCIVENSRGSSNRSIVLDTNAPPAPSNLQITPTPTSATISWSVIPPEAFVREYQLNYTYMGTCPDTEGLSFSEIVRGGAVTSHTLLDLVGNSFYTGYLTAFNDGGRSEDVSFNFSTTTSVPTGPPSSHTVQSVTMTTITVTWERVECLLRNSDVTGYRLTTESRYGTTVDEVVGTGAGNRSFVFSPLVPHTLYDVTIAALGDGGLVGPQLMFNVTTAPVEDLVLQLNGERHPSHSLLDPSAVGEGSQALLCLTPDLTCCRGGIFGTRGNWFDSSGEDLPTREELAGGDEFYDNRGESALRLNRVGGGASSFPGGMFRCEIPDVNNTLQELFVGLYPPNTGGPVITELVYDPSTTSLSCTSNGGPVTSLTWTQDQLPLGSEVATSYQTVADISSAQYLNILQLSREGERGNVGTYECRVSNVRGNDSRELRVVESLIAVPISVLVGVPASFSCSGDTSGAPSASIQWLNASGHVVAMETEVASLQLRFDPVEPSLDNVTYFCQVSNHVTTSVLISVQNSGPPLNLASSPIATGFSFTWSPPQDSLPAFFSYQLSCEPALAGLDTLVRTTGAGGSSVGVGGMEEGREYVCMLIAMVEGYVSSAAVISVMTNETAPVSAPPSFTVTTTGPRDITFSWEELPLRDQNGFITRYTLTCTAEVLDTAPSRSFTSAGSSMLGEFRPNTSYECAVFAVNSAAQGPSSTVRFNTTDEKSLFQVELSSVANCHQWAGIDGPDKEMAIRRAIITQINQRCPTCLLTDDRVTSGRLSCFDEDLTTVTYRAEIHGTVDRTSSQLLTDIQRWTDSAPSILVLSVSMMIVAGCRVEIQTFDDTKCPLSTSPVIGLPIIVGGALGGVIVVMLCCIIVVVCAVVCRRKGKVKRRTITDLSRHDGNRDSGLYEVIHERPLPPWPPRDPQPAAATAANTKDAEQCTTFTNTHQRTGSTASGRYGPTPNHTAKLHYVEVDGAPAAGYNRERRPSDYEPVLVRGRLMTTEESGSFSPTRMGGKLEPVSLPPPCSNTYEGLSNPGFLSSEDLRTDSSPAVPIPHSTSGDIAITQNASYSELPGANTRHMRARSLSQAKNPMYSTVKPKQAREDANHVQNPNFVQYETIPHDVPNKASTSDTKMQDQQNRVANSTSSLSTYDVPPNSVSSTAISNPGYTAYDVPTNNTLSRENLQAESVLNPGFSNYDVPPNNALSRESLNGVGSPPTYDVPPNNTLSRESLNGVVSPPTYDVPPNNTLSRESLNRVVSPPTYDVPPNNTLSRESLNRVGSPMYDVPPNNSLSRDSSGVVAPSNYDVPKNTLARESDTSILANPSALSNSLPQTGDSPALTERMPSPHPNPGLYDVPQPSNHHGNDNHHPGNKTGNFDSPETGQLIKS